MGRAARWALVLLLGPRLFAGELFTGVDPAALMGVAAVRCQVTPVLDNEFVPSDLPAVVRLRVGERTLGGVAVYTDEATARAACAACAGWWLNGGECQWVGTRRPDWVRVAQWPNSPPKLWARFANLVWVDESSESVAGLLRHAAQVGDRLARAGCATRGKFVALPVVSVEPRPGRRGLAHTQLWYEHPALSRVPELLSPACSLGLPGSSGTRHSSGGEHEFADGPVGEPIEHERQRPGLATYTLWFATRRCVVFPVRGEFTVQPCDDSNAWLEPWTPSTRAFDASRWRPVERGSRAAELGRARRLLARYVRPAWLPPEGLATVYQTPDSTRPLCALYRGGRVRLAWSLGPHGRQRLCVSQPRLGPASPPAAEVAPEQIFRDGAPFDADVYERPSVPDGVAGPLVVYHLDLAPPPWWRHGWLLAIAVFVLARWRRRRRAQAEQRF